MIPQAYIIEWSNNVPWNTNEQIEQDLVICRALVEIFNDDFLAENLAFRGGTALHKLFLSPQPIASQFFVASRPVVEPPTKTFLYVSRAQGKALVPEFQFALAASK